MIPLGEWLLEGDAATAAWALRLAPALRGGDVLALVGDMGAGKSTFCRALGRALGVPAEIPMPSPSFSVVLEYPLTTAGLGTEQASRPERLVHADIYRLADEDELIPLGVELAPSVPSGALTVVEWADRLPEAFGPATLWMQWTDVRSGTARSVQLAATDPSAASHWRERLHMVELC